VTASKTIQADVQPRTRRALLAGVLGGLGAWAVSTAARVSPAEAAAGDPIRMGRLNTARGTSTTLQTASSQPTFRAVQLADGSALRAEAGHGRAVMATAGRNGTAVWAYSPDHYAIRANCPTGIAAVHAETLNGTGVFGMAKAGTGVWGTSVSGAAMRAQGAVGIEALGNPAAHFEGEPTAAWFVGAFQLTGAQDIWELPEPAAPVANRARLFARDNGSGKTQLCVRFATGAVQVIATEP